MTQLRPPLQTPGACPTRGHVLIFRPQCMYRPSSGIKPETNQQADQQGAASRYFVYSVQSVIEYLLLFIKFCSGSLLYSNFVEKLHCKTKVSFQVPVLGRFQGEQVSPLAPPWTPMAHTSTSYCFQGLENTNYAYLSSVELTKLPLSFFITDFSSLAIV